MDTLQLYFYRSARFSFIEKRKNVKIAWKASTDETVTSTSVVEPINLMYDSSRNRSSLSTDQ